MRRDPLQPLDIRDPKVFAAIETTENLVVWEMLRRFDRPASADELAAAAKYPRRTVQGALAAFEAIGLVGRKRATRGVRGFGWVVTAPAIVVAFRVADAQDLALLARRDAVFERARRQEIAAAIKPAGARTTTDCSWTSMHAVSLDPTEIRELWDLLQGLARFLARTTERFRGAGPEVDHACTHHLTIELAPLLPGVLPLPNIQIIGQQFASEVAEKIAGDWTQSLAKREIEIARRLARGAPTKTVAADLGLSLHTVVEYTRRIYRKLGVKSRAQLAARIHAGG